MKTQSQDLTYFYRRYADWLLSGAHMNPHFTRSVGLCGLLWMDEYPRDVRVELKMQFHFAGFNISGPSLIPFNDNLGNWIRESENNLCHLNPKRIQWVQERLNH